MAQNIRLLRLSMELKSLQKQLPLRRVTPSLAGAIMRHGICMVHVMVYVRKTHTMPETLCTSVFQPSDGIWYMFS